MKHITLTLPDEDFKLIATVCAFSGERVKDVALEALKEWVRSMMELSPEGNQYEGPLIGELLGFDLINCETFDDILKSET